MIEFLKEFWEFLKRKKKYWLLPIILVLSFIWSINCFKPRFSSSSIYLYDFLSDIYTWHISFLSRQCSGINNDENIVASAGGKIF